VLGHTGLVGSAFVDALERERHVVLVPRRRVNLENVYDTHRLIGNRRPEWVVLAAARVGGIGANLDEAAQMILCNSRIQNNVLEAAAACGSVRRFLFLGSSCLYPRTASAERFVEDDLGYGPLEPSNKGYALAKLLGIELCRAYASETLQPIVLMPPNLHGRPERDNYDPTRSHVLQALIKRIYEAKLNRADSVTVWGDGAPLREFMRAEEVARVGVRLLEAGKLDHLVYNVGHGYDASVAALARRIASRLDYRGMLRFDGDLTRNGVAHKTMDCTRLRKAIGWAPSQSMFDEIDQTIDEYLDVPR